MFRNVQEAVIATLFRGRTNLVITSHTCCSSLDQLVIQTGKYTITRRLTHSLSLSQISTHTDCGWGRMDECVFYYIMF